jgi:hypothetical protein
LNESVSSGKSARSGSKSQEYTAPLIGSLLLKGKTGKGSSHCFIFWE